MTKFDIIRLSEDFLFSVFNKKRWIVDCFSKNDYLEKNKLLLDQNEERCYILYPSVKLTDEIVEFLKGKFTISSNHYYRTDYFNKIIPKVHCALDENFFIGSRKGGVDYIKKTVEEFDETKFIFSKLFLKYFDYSSDNIFIVNNIYKPTSNYFPINLAKGCSNPSTVGLFMIMVAMYMKFSKIYLLGYQLPPWKNGLMPHIYNEHEYEKKNAEIMVNDTSLSGQCSLHWQYYRAQVESYYLEKLSVRNKITIKNYVDETFCHAFKVQELAFKNLL